ncbi:breast cancer type 2 susceptibility protein homolog isoform X2 [Drosophila obscura]|uniref:breast cancer type 2 susceptibility protein homolog isoform X2 n=1 Tax=Drosophila obscura TaxID=7282 RepID=UPI001BB2B66C|nr:breast cancer type 2 susceptibility protein homolog isoform X2 [Drosophila obscura]
MDLEHIVASPSASDSNSSVHSQRLRRRDKRRLDNGNNTASDHLPPGNTSIAAEVANIYRADRQDSLLALQIPHKNRSVGPSSEFISMHDLLLSQADYSTTVEKEEAPVHISELILRDFCSSPTYEEEKDIPICDSPPWFRFRKKRINTYSRKPPTQKEPTVADDEDEDDRLSCSSGLSVQEDHTVVTRVPAPTALCELDGNSSQKICENLLNLSEYFSLSNTSPNPNKATESVGIHKAIAANTSIDLAIKQEDASLQRNNMDPDSPVECTSVEFENLEEDLLKLGYTYEASDVCDTKQHQGNETNTLFAESGSFRRSSPANDASELDAKVCEEWSKGDSFLVDYNTEKIPLSDDEPAQTDTSDENPTKRLETTEPSSHLLLEDIPISEWQTKMDIPDTSNCKTEASAQEMDNTTVKLEETAKIEVEFLKGIPDCEPITFRTASNKPIEVSEEMQMKAAKLLADVEGDEWNRKDIGEFVGFRTASNKPIKVSEDNEKKAAKLMADVQAADQMSETSDTQFLQGITLSQWQPMDVQEDVPFRTTSKKCIRDSEEMRLKADVSKPKPSSSRQNHEEINMNEGQEMDVSEFVGFRTASNKPIEVSEEMKKKGAKLLADFEATDFNELNPIDIPETIGFRTASNKPIKVSEDSEKKAAKLLADVQAADQMSETSDTQFLQGITLSQWPPMDIPEVVPFRTASNKFQVSEEMRMKSGEVSNPKPSSSHQDHEEMNMNEEQEMDVSEFVGFRTASNKPIEISDEMKKRGAKLIADVEAETTNQPNLKSCDPECQSEMSDYRSDDDFKGFPSDELQPLDFLDLNVFPRLSQKAEETHANDSKSGTPKQRRETSDGIPSSKRRRQDADCQLSSSPQQREQHGRQLSKTTSCHSALGSPIKSLGMPDSLSQLAERSPLDPITKTSVIARRNLLSLSSRRKRVSTAGECQVQDNVTPVKPRFAPMFASTSTPLSNRNINRLEESRGGEDVSPICKPFEKVPRLGLSRSRY